MELATTGSIELKPDKWQMATAIASVLSVLAVGIGLIVTNDYNREQQELSRQGQITDRFTKAVEQLGQPGPDKIDIRLGAIYALQRIMRDSEDDQPAVVDILSAFIRVHAPTFWRPLRQLEPDPGPSPRPVDIQAALTVLARRNPVLDREGRVDLSEANLSQAVLRGADLLAANLRTAYLRSADLKGADLRGADLQGADLRGAYLNGADLRGADLLGADLRGAQVGYARLGGADLEDAKLEGARLGGLSSRGDELTYRILGCARRVDDDPCRP